MAAEPQRTPNEIIRFKDGAVTWGPVAGLDDGALAIIDRSFNSGPRTFSIARLDADGGLVAESKPLPVSVPVFGGCIVVVESGKAVLVVRDRKEDRMTLHGTPCCFCYDQPRWFRCSWNAKAIIVTEIGFWEGMAIGSLTAKRSGITTSWTMAKTTYKREPTIAAESKLAFGFASGSSPPKFQLTDVPCGDVSHAPESHTSLLALVESGCKQVSLWRLTAEGKASQITAISPAKQHKGEVSGPAILALPDGYLFLWRYYNKKIKRDQRDGGIWFRTSDPTLSEFDEPRRFSDDREILAGKWLACNLRETGLVMWVNGVGRAKQHVRFVRVHSRFELPKPHQDFTGEFPNHVLPMKRGLLVLSTKFSDEPYFWRLETQRLDDLG